VERASHLVRDIVRDHRCRVTVGTLVRRVHMELFPWQTGWAGRRRRKARNCQPSLDTGNNILRDQFQKSSASDYSFWFIASCRSFCSRQASHPMEDKFP
jgi:hypothetical protein